MTPEAFIAAYTVGWSERACASFAADLADVVAAVTVGLGEKKVGDAAREVVDYVLDYVEKVGSFDGRGRRRELMLDGFFVNMRTGESTEHVDRLQSEVTRILAGTATYRRRQRGGPA